MTSPMDEHTSSATDRHQTLVEAIDRYLVDGMPVDDMNGEQVGDVKLYSTTAGYLVVRYGPLEQQDLYLPFRLIRSIDPHDIFVSATKDMLTSRYTQPPTITTVVENRLVPGPNGSMTPQTYEVQVVQSGFDGQPAEVNRVDLGSVADRLAVGMVVQDVKGERLGDLTQYDAQRRLMVVETGIVKPKSLLVPFSAIQEIHPVMFTVYLSLPRAVLMKEHAMLPADA